MTGKATIKSQHLIHQLNADVDVASRQSLQSYDDGRLWFFVNHSELSLGRVGQVIIENDTAQMTAWAAEGQVMIYPSLSCVEGGNFWVLWFENAYVLAPYSRGGR
ncbi:MAG: hypothetical protein WBA57_18405 [Elainellaceae cyanobacterium]